MSNVFFPSTGTRLDRSPFSSTLVLAAVLLLVSLAGWAAASPTELDDAVREFTGAESGYVELDVLALEEDLNDSLPASGSVFLPSATLHPLTKAVLLLENAEGSLSRSRHHMSVRVVQAESLTPEGSEPVLFVQLDRYNLGPAIRAELAESLGDEHVAPAEEFGVGPHVSWRYVMHQVMGQNAALLAAARLELSAEDAAEAICVGAPCLQTHGAVEELAVWQELVPVELLAELEEVPYQAVELGLPTPGAMVDLLASRAHLQPYYSETVGLDRVAVELLLESGLAPEPVMEIVARQGDLLDDSLEAIWHRLLSFSFTGTTPEFLEAPAYQCRRGGEGWAAPGQYCP